MLITRCKVKDEDIERRLRKCSADTGVIFELHQTGIKNIVKIVGKKGSERHFTYFNTLRETPEGGKGIQRRDCNNITNAINNLVFQFDCLNDYEL